MKTSPTRRRKHRGARSAKQHADDNSVRRRGVLRLAGVMAKAERAAAPKCGARRRDGGACQKIPVAGRTRCRNHGGASGSGDTWHVIQLPADPAKRARKLRDIARRRERQAVRVAALSPEQRAQYEKRKLSMQPGGRAAREAVRRDREAALLLNSLRQGTHPSAEAQALASEIATLKVRLATLRSPAENQQKDQADV